MSIDVQLLLIFYGIFFFIQLSIQIDGEIKRNIMAGEALGTLLPLQNPFMVAYTSWCNHTQIRRQIWSKKCFELRWKSFKHFEPLLVADTWSSWRFLFSVFSFFFGCCLNSECIIVHLVLILCILSSVIPFDKFVIAYFISRAWCHPKSCHCELAHKNLILPHMHW